MMEDHHNDTDESADEYLETSSISSSEGSEASFSCFDNESDFDIWSPMHDSETDTETPTTTNNVLQFEDKDDVALLTLNASHFVTQEEEESVAMKLKEHKNMVWEKMINNEFSAHVAQLLRFFEIRKTELGGGESWIDIVTKLAWEAASFVRPDAFEYRAKNLDHFVKITCVAAGSPSQSEVVKGLIFKKHAMHKHMKTVFSNPKLLLARGFLGQVSSGFISFDKILSPIRGKNPVVASVAKYLKASGADVVLVERGASRDLVDVLLTHGLNIAIVSNMKLQRLERIARCTTSTIMSIDPGRAGGSLSQFLSLRSCDRVVFRSIVEEHFGHHVTREERRRTHKTLMFIEGCPTRLGCTVLLKGSHSDELKKIKRVVRAAVFTAYHLMRVTSFRMDLNAMFSASAGVNAGERTKPSHPPSTPLDEVLKTGAPSRVGSSNGKVGSMMATTLNFSRGLVCDHGKCSVTNFTLAKYILDYLLNQSWRCKTCKEGCEAHVYYYAHNNTHIKQQVGVRVQQLQAGECLLPYAEDKDENVWFWRHCAKCKVESSAKRSLISEEALGLPFGRFLDLYFSNPSPFDFPLPHCTHSPHTHSLLFIGSESMVAVFKYSSMVIKGEVEVVEAS